MYLIAISSFLHILSFYKNKSKSVIVFKILSTTLLFILSIYINQDFNFYHKTIAIGLFFSWFGDVFLLFPEKFFIQGLVSFLLAHIAYIIAFKSNLAIVSYFYLIPFIIYGFLMFSLLKKNLGELKVPVIIYISFIMLMVFLALNKWLLIKDINSLYGLTGAFLFMISDSILAIDKFFKKFFLAEFLLLTTYYIAQVLIIFSIK
ncbi:MAG: lysoplasmalogenase [Candidatus Sericytochromatia bacterium]